MQIAIGLYPGLTALDAIGPSCSHKLNFSEVAPSDGRRPDYLREVVDDLAGDTRAGLS
jgi:hypothetical protein